MALVDKGGYLVDDNQWKKMRKNLERGSHLAAKIGFFQDSTYGPENDNLTVAQVAQWQEEGTDKIPMRPFIRSGFMEKVQQGKWITPQVLRWIDDIAMGKSTWTAMYNKLGPVFVKMMQDEIRDWKIPMNAPLTVQLKGFNDPLIDTGKMLDSVDYLLGRKSGGQ